MECNFVNLVIHVRADNVVHLALSLPLMGSAYSNACRIEVCTCLSRDCATCSDRGECDWYSVFGQELACDPTALKRHQKPPLPFVFSFPLPGLTLENQDIFVCGLVVVGTVISCLGMLLAGFSRLLNGSAFPVRGQVVQVFTKDYQGTLTTLISCEQTGMFANLAVLSSADLLVSVPWGNNHCALRLLSPLKLRVAGRYVRRFDFSLFVRSLMRRVSSLMYYYENVEPIQDFKDLSRQADEIVCIEDRFGFDNGFGGSKQMAGIVGQGRFKGNISELIPFLVLGSYFHAGKNASFGFGACTVLAE